MEKPSRIAYRYESWRGTAGQLADLARTLQAEVERAVELAKQYSDKEIDRMHEQWLVQYEQNLRARSGFQPNAPPPVNVQAELAQAILQAEAYRAQRKKDNADFIRRGTKITFGYTDKGGRRLSSKDPAFLEKVTNPDGIFLQGLVVSSPAATISLTLQNRPWEWLTLEAEGEDPDWVSSAVAPLHQSLAARESKIVWFFRNAWVKGIFGIFVWALFIPPTALIIERLGLDRLMAVVIAAIPLALVSAIYQRLTRPLIITSAAPSAWFELVKVALPAVVTAALRLVLDGLAKLAGSLLR